MENKEDIISNYTGNFPEINKNRPKKAEKISQILRYFVPEINECTIADLGCSNGIITTHLASICRSIRGLDMDISQVSSAEIIPSNCVFTSCDILHTPLEDKSVDVVVCNHVYQWFEHPEFLVQEIVRITKPQGYVYFSGPTRFAPLGEHQIPFAPFFPKKSRKKWVRFWNKKKDFELTYFFPGQVPHLFKNLEAINLFAYFVGIPLGAPKWLCTFVNVFSWISPTFVYLFRKTN